MGRKCSGDDSGPKQRRNTLVNPGTPVKPEGLSERAGFYWDQLLGQLVDSGVMLVIGDATLITLGATVKADLEVSWAAVQEGGRYLTNVKSGAVKLNPAVDDCNRLSERLQKILWQLNLSPRSRGNPPVAPKKEDDEQSLEDFLNSD
jgi:phage terminase small subunit